MPLVTWLENSRAWVAMMPIRLNSGIRITRSRMRQVRAEARAL